MPAIRAFRLFACVVIVFPAAADIITTGGAVTVLSSPPASVQLNQLESNTDVFAFQEQHVFSLPLPLAVDVTAPGTYSHISDIPLLPSYISTGTTLNSYYLSSDPNIPLLPLGYGLYSGSVTFGPGESVIGIEFLEPSLLLGAAEVGASGTKYPPLPVGYGLEMGNDSFTLSADLKTVSFSLKTGGGDDTGGVDQIRILTAVNPVPEPTSVALMLSGVCCLALARRKFKR